MRPAREPARNNQQTYFLTFTTVKRTPFFRHERWIESLLNVLATYAKHLVLHDFVVIQDHVHVLLAPAGPLQHSAQLVKGGFSYRAKRELDRPSDIWQAGYSDHRVRDLADYEQHRKYIKNNLHSLSTKDENHRHSSGGRLLLSPIPPWLKPQVQSPQDGAAEAAPFQSKTVLFPVTAQRG